LGPLLFNVFTADLSSLSLNAQLYMYADDVLLVKSFAPADSISASVLLTNDLQSIAEWSTSSGLLLNPSKSLSLLVGSPVMLSRIQSFHVSLNSTPLISSSTACILGLHVDCSWSFQHHVTIKCRAAYARLRLLYPLRHILSTQQKLHLSQLLVLSLFDYADIIYVPSLNKCLLSLFASNGCKILVFAFLSAFASTIISPPHS